MALTFGTVIILANVAAIVFVVGGHILTFTVKLGWLVKITPLYHIQIGLFKLKFGEGVAPMIVGFLAKSVQKSAASAFKAQKTEEAIISATEQQRFWDINAFREYACHAETLQGIAAIRLDDLCFLWNVVQIASMLYISLVPIFLLVFVAGGISDFYYQKVHARARGRRLTTILYTIAPCALLFLLMIYMLLTQFLVLMPPVNAGYPWGFCVWVAGVLNIIAFFPLCMHLYGDRRSLDELRNENKSAEKKFVRDYGDLLAYGATPSTGMPGPSMAGNPAMIGASHLAGAAWAGPAQPAWGAPAQSAW